MAASTRNMIFHRIEGIPCYIDVTTFIGGRDAITHGPADNWEPEFDEVIEYDIYDRKGYKAKWLENKIDRDIDADIIRAIKNNR